MDLAIFSLKHRFSKPKKPYKVFGIGTLRTGTTSLGAALQILGCKHTHARRDYLLKCVDQGRLEQVFRWVERHDSFEDWPWPLIYQDLDKRYPGSKFILTTRADDATWLESIKRHAKWTGPTPGRKMFFGHEMPHGHEKQYLQSYREHNDLVRDHFRGRFNSFLEVCWEKGDGWPELCRFLGEPVPDKSFPKLNSSANRLKKWG
jgi:hypothetical protein